MENCVQNLLPPFRGEPYRNPPFLKVIRQMSTYGLDFPAPKGCII
jgi:hypothetical protein